MYWMFLQAVVSPETPISTEKLWQVSPYNALGYGLAILVLCFTCWAFYGLWKKERDYSRDLSSQMVQYNKDVLQVMAKVELRLGDQQTLVSNVQSIQQNIGVLLKDSENILRKIDSKYSANDTRT